MEIVKKKEFANGIVYALRLKDGRMIETTDTFLPKYTEKATLKSDEKDYGSRLDRWMIGVSTMSGCPVGCKFCATGTMDGCRNLTAQEIVDQVDFITASRKEKFSDAYEHKINYTRMGEPFLNVENVKKAVSLIEETHPDTHHYISTIGVKGSVFSWIKKNITLQISVHSFDEEERDWLIPFKNKMTLDELGSIRTQSNLKSTVNLTLPDETSFDIEKLKKYFSKDHFFVKLSPINNNTFASSNGLEDGAIKQ
jgi:23S rRNA (adenine2503-C2)-methyltransferase